MSDDFAIRIQLVDRGSDQIIESFDAEVPNRVRGIESSKEEAPYLVSKMFFDHLEAVLNK